MNVISDIKDTIYLPALEFTLKQDIGYVKHVLKSRSKQKIINIADIQISTRIKEKSFALSNGEKVIITSRDKIDCPISIDGVLHLSKDGNLTWKYHKNLKEFENNISTNGLTCTAKEILNSWENSFKYKSEQKNQGGAVRTKGLRPPQIGALHAIGSHWSLYNQAATIVMPTGTGKTETMVSSLVAFKNDPTLIIVPSNILRKQTFEKFTTLGLLRTLSCVPQKTRNPIVGIINKRPKKKEDLEIFKNCNVIVSTMSALTGGTADRFTSQIAKLVSVLIVDEAHHIGASTWTSFKEKFTKKKIIQFTATPYRSDGKLVDGKVIFEYQLYQAQQDNYFKKINFKPIYEVEQAVKDEAIAKAAVEKLKSDISSGYDHVMMARCSSIDRATDVYKIYEQIAPELSPVLIHSEVKGQDEEIENLRIGKYKIAVCVNMLGEGFDLPQLKIAAIHDSHKSLAVLLQFTGRFTRTSGKKIGDATVIANTADDDVELALERLYKEDADWNQLLSEFSSNAAKSHAEFIDFLNNSQVLWEHDEESPVDISNNLLRPALSTLVYRANSFNPKKFVKSLDKDAKIFKVWWHEETQTLYFVVKTEPNVKWTRSKEIFDRQWNLFVIHFDPKLELLFIAASDKSSLHEQLAQSVGATEIISGDTVFRSLGNINRLIFQNIGVRKHGRRNLSFALYTGSDVAEALSITERTSSVKSNLSGSGWEDGAPITIGCSLKGRVWSRDAGTIPELIKWCKKVGIKLKNKNINTTDIIKNVLIPKEIKTVPEQTILVMEWPVEILHQSEDRVTLISDTKEIPISMFELSPIGVNKKTNSVDFSIKDASGQISASYYLQLETSTAFTVKSKSNNCVNIQIGKLKLSLEEYLSNYPPLIRFVDLSELDGNLLIKTQQKRIFKIPQECFKTWDWTGVDRKKESMWKHSKIRKDSIQWHTAQEYLKEDFSVIFDDDNPGEISDLICIKEENDYIRLVLLHCKFTSSSKSGERIKDVIEVCAQAVKSAKWKGSFKDLCRHIVNREKRFTSKDRKTRFLVGSSSEVNNFAKISRLKEIKPEIIIVQPGLSKKNYTKDQGLVLAAAHTYLKETIDVDLGIICDQ